MEKSNTAKNGAKNSEEQCHFSPINGYLGDSLSRKGVRANGSPNQQTPFAIIV